ncbi:hypothetical protein LCGC14_2176880 [marine sediment metagenome]|uniref:Uncharacterized protein n=1 Tax=marine sediment metagenome TaxID=412755 RepID=A0A0F9EAR4_9ZZZZ
MDIRVPNWIRGRRHIPKPVSRPEATQDTRTGLPSSVTIDEVQPKTTNAVPGMRIGMVVAGMIIIVMGVVFAPTMTGTITKTDAPGAQSTGSEEITGLPAEETLDAAAQELAEALPLLYLAIAIMMGVGLMAVGGVWLARVGPLGRDD